MICRIQEDVMKQVLTDIAKAIVDAPESVVVTEKEEGVISF